MGVITYDIEIERSPDDVVGGWEAARRGDCGLASVALYDTRTERYHVYDVFTLDKCIDHLNSADLLVGFNSIEFDTPCLEAVAGQAIDVPQYDILQQVWKVTGGRRKGYGLGPICERTLGIGKSGTGEHAPKLYQEGRYAELYDYNINDVHLTRQLYNHIAEHGWIIGTEKQKVKLWTPEAHPFA